MRIVNKHQKVFTNSISTVAAKIINAFLQFISLPVLLKVYGKEGYGLIAIAMSLNTFIAILQLGLPTGIPKFVAEWFAKKNYDIMQKAVSSVFSFYLFLACLNLIVILVVQYFFLDYFRINSGEIGTFRALLIITAIVSFASIPINYLDQLLTGVQEIAFISKQQMIKNLLFACLVLFVLINPHGLTLVQFYALNCLTMVLMVPSKVRRWQRYAPLKTFIPKFYFKETIPLLKYCLNLFVMSFFILMADKVKPIILSFRTTGDAAIKMAEYQIVYNFSLFINMIASSIMVAFIPYISHEYAAGNHGIYKRVIQDITKPVWAFGGWIVFCTILLSKELLVIYVGPSNLFLEKWLILFIISSSYILYASCISAVVLASSRTLPYAIATSVACLVSLVICWLFVPISALGGMIYSYIAYIGIVFIFMHFFYLPKLFKISPLRQIFNILLPPLLIGIVMILVIRQLLDLVNYKSPVANIFIGGVCGTLLYSTLILFIYLKPKELGLFWHQIVTK